MPENERQGAEGAPAGSEVAAPAGQGAQGASSVVVQPGKGSAEKESVPGGPLLIGAYLFIWVALFAWLLFVRRSQVRLEREVEQLEERLDRHIGQTR